MWVGSVAVLRGVQPGADPAAASVVPTVRSAVVDRGAAVSRLSTGIRRVGQVAVPVRGSGAIGGASAEVLRVARRRGGARRRDRGMRADPVRRRHHLGAARPSPIGRARLRPGPCARERARTAFAHPGAPVAAPHGHRRSPSAATGSRAAGGDAGRVRRDPNGTAADPPGGRRPHDRGDGRGLRRGACRGRRPPRPPGDRRPVVPRSGGRAGPRVARTGPPCLSSGGPTSGSVVARGTSPVVDASRGRNDPRKATLGRRAWRGLDVRPAPGDRERAKVRSPRTSGRPGERPGRRVWGQRPGQPDAEPTQTDRMPSGWI
jgi:hypothetical protein